MLVRTQARSKPRQPVLQRGHRLARGLSGAYLFNAPFDSRDYSGAGRDFLHQNMEAEEWAITDKGVSLKGEGAPSGEQLNGPASSVFFSNTSGGSIICLCKPTTSTASQRMVTLKGSANTWFGIGFDRPSGPDKFALMGRNSSSSFIEIFSNSTVTLGEWYLVVGTVGPDGGKIYVNSILENSSATFDANTMLTGLADAAVISAFSTNSGIFDGYICSVSIYDRELPVNEVAELYRDPWGMWTPQMRFAVPEPAAAGGFSSFWASQATKVSGVL